MNAFDDTDWSRWLLGACSSGDPLRNAVVRNAEQVAVLRARLAELESQTHTWVADAITDALTRVNPENPS